MIKFFIPFLKRLGYQCCVGHFGITTMAFVLSLQIFAATFPKRLKGFQFIEKASFTMVLESASIILLIYAGGKKVYT